MANRGRDDVGQSEGGRKWKRFPPLLWVVIAILVAWLLLIAGSMITAPGG